jgi:serine/threonine-protein kinase
MFLQAGTSIAVSPGGDHLVVVLGDPNDTTGVQLWSRSLDDPTYTVLAPSLAYSPFFSPDGEWVGFVSPTQLQKVPITGGTPLVLCEVSRPRGASWGVNGTIAFAGTPNSGLSLVSQEGGAPQVLTTLDEAAEEVTHRWPQFLPDGKHVLFTSLTAGSDFNRATLEIVNVESGERQVVHRGGSFGRYLPTGHLLYVNAGTLFAMPFDLGTLAASGSAVPVVNGVESAAFDGNAQFDVSAEGFLVYRAAERREVPVHIAQWVDRDGEGSTLWGDAGTYAEPRVSPDGTKAVFMVLAGRNWDLWTYDMQRDVSTRLTFDAAADGPAVWSPDGEEVIFSSSSNGADDLYRRRSDGSGEIERITSDPDVTLYVSDWSRDGRYVLVTSQSATAGAGAGIGYLDLEGDGTVQTFLPPSPSRLSEAMFSPNGRWVAYQSDESGQTEVYVRPFPPAGGKWQVSDAGGAYPNWSADGGELYYRTDDGLAMVTVDTRSPTFSAGRARQLFRGAFRGGIGGVTLDGSSYAHYDVGPDGRFVMFPAPPTEEQPNIEWLQVVDNWFTELNRRVPTGR